jgi:hypothetical protein
MAGMNTYYAAVREFLDAKQAGFDELRAYTGLSVKEQLVELLAVGLREELVTKEILEQDHVENLEAGE